MQCLFLFTSRKAGQHVLLVQGGRGKGGKGTFSFLETSVHVKPLENLWASNFGENFGKFEKFWKIWKFLKILKNIVKYPKFWFFSNFEFFLKFWKNLKSLKFFEIFDNFFQNFEWITRLVQLASLAGRSGLLGTWGLLLLAHFPRPPPLGAYVKTFRHLHLWPQKPFPTSAPTFCGFRKAGERRYGSEGEIIIVESGVLGESDTPSGDLLGYRDS